MSQALVAAGAFGLLALLAPLAGGTQTPPPSPAPTPKPAGTPNPCGGDTLLLSTLNRPTIGFSPCAAAAGTAITELGYFNAANGNPGSGNAVQVGQPFIRFGAADRLELDLIPPNYNLVRSTGSPVQHGFADGGVGMKFELPPSARSVFGVDALLTFQTGSGGFSNGAPVATVNLNQSYSMSPATGVGATAAFSSSAGPDASGRIVRYFTFNPSAVLTAQVPGGTQFYGELYYVSKVGPGGGSRTILNGGIQKLFGPHLEVDAEIGQTLYNAGAPRFHFFSFGVGIQT
ncbi:MAG: hypothetical protein GIW95_03890 [Candidatus Eremiobacteraeota bacterium]|nr:hypothetical protein [Candidatus Eremiobacteraeota bacterium]